MNELLEDNGLGEKLEEKLMEETDDAGSWLGFNTDLDEDSDTEDPEIALRATLAEKTSFVEAITSALERSRMQIELERSRMQMEDLRAQLVCKHL